MNILLKKWRYRIGIGIGVFALWLALGGVFSPVEASMSQWLDFNFEDFTNGDINGQGNWTTDGGTFDIESTGTYVFSKLLHMTWLSSSYKSAIYGDSWGDASSGVEYVDFYLQPVSGSGMLVIQGITYMLFQDQGGTTWRFEDAGGNPMFGSNTVQEGHWVKVRWTLDWTEDKQTFEAWDEGDNYWGLWTYSSHPPSGLNLSGTVYWQNAMFNAEVKMEGFGQPAPPEASVWATAPESGSEITSLEDEITVEWEGLTDYESLYISLRHPYTGLFTDALEYDIVDIGGSGDMDIPLSSFNIEKNGNWYLHAVAVREGYQIEQGMFLSGYGWIWSDDLTDGEYYLAINIEGYEEVFAMSDFTSWYDENAKFDEPTDMFSAIAGFFEPIFSKVGEFGSRIQDYFDIDTAYSKGYEIGKAIPVFAYYVEQVADFMGGFPLMNWLLVIILLLVGIFIFRVILKFIPFLGG